jgi:hypothetical protein
MALGVGIPRGVDVAVPAAAESECGVEVETLRHGERELWRTCQAGGTVDLSGVADRTVRADVIEELLTGVDPSRPPIVRALRLVHGVIDGELDLCGARISFPLSFEDCDFTSAPNLQEARLLSLSLRQCRLPGLSAEGMEVQGSVRMDAGFASTGEVNLIGAHIGGSLYLRDARLENALGEINKVLNASRIRVGSHLSCTGTEIQGQLRLISAKIGGVLNLRNTKLLCPEDICLQGERMEVGEGIWFGPNFVAEGRLLLNHARVNGGVDLEGSTLTKPERMQEPDRLKDVPVSLRATRIRVGRNLNCTKGFNCGGGVEIDSADVGGRLSFRDAAYCGSGQTINLSGTSAEIIDLVFRDRPAGDLNLQNARATVLVDEVRTWPEKITLEGFEYAHLQPYSEISVDCRINWLRRTRDGYVPQPYEQLIASYRAAGRDQEARRVALAKQRARRHELSLPGRIWGSILEVTVGYGYRTWLAGIWLLGLTLVGTVLFQQGRPTPLADKPPIFQAFVYTLDLLLPVADFGQERAWRFGGGLQWMAWSYVVAGWLLTTAVIAGVTRVLNRSS